MATPTMKPWSTASTPRGSMLRAALVVLSLSSIGCGAEDGTGTDAMVLADSDAMVLADTEPGDTTTTPDVGPDATTTDVDSDTSDAVEDAPDAEDTVEDLSDTQDAVEDVSDAQDVPDSAPTGPRLIASDPADGAIDAPLRTWVRLEFDRPVTVEDAAGKIFATSDVLTEPTPMMVFGCFAEPTCLQAYFDSSFGEGRLRGSTRHTIILDKSLPDADGNTNAADTVISYTTHEFSLVVDDSSEDRYEAGGIAYDPGTSSLFYCFSTFEGALAVRRVRFDDREPQPPTTFFEVDTLGLGGPTCRGLDVIDGRLYVMGSYARRVWVFDDLDADVGTPSEVIVGTSLPSPDDSLGQVNSVAALDGGARLLFGIGYYFNAPRPTAIPQRLDGAWSLFGTGSFPTSEDFTVATREDVAPGIVYVAAAGGLYKLSALDGSLLNMHPAIGGNASLRIDSAGRLYAYYAGLGVFDTAGDQGFELLFGMDFMPFGRLAIHERGNMTYLYILEYRETPRVFRTQLMFCDGPEPCESSCDNGVRDGSETATDCGGTCDRCPLGSPCARDTDCAGGYCDRAVCVSELQVGCADGTREGFVDVESAREIAGCSGAWREPGVVGVTTPTCDRQGGNNGGNQDGDGCSVADLCAPGWKVCASPMDVATRAPGGSCAGATRPGDPQLFFATAVQSAGNGACVAGDPALANDLFGCGNLGATPDAASCAPLDRFSGNRCSSLLLQQFLFSWACGTGDTTEGFAVQKWEPEGGGVLCCRCDCGDAVCGEDGCGGSCGTCPGSETCDAGQCVPSP